MEREDFDRTWNAAKKSMYQDAATALDAARVALAEAEDSLEHAGLPELAEALGRFYVPSICQHCGQVGGH